MGLFSINSGDPHVYPSLPRLRTQLYRLVMRLFLINPIRSAHHWPAILRL